MTGRILPALRLLERALAATLLVAVVSLVFVATITRYLGSPIIWSLEAAQALFVWLCFLAADITLQNFGHFSVSALADLLPVPARRLLDTFNGVVVLALLAFLAWYGFNFTDMTSMRPLPMLGVSEAIATAALPVGFALMAITVVEQTVRRWTSSTQQVVHTPRDVM